MDRIVFPVSTHNYFHIPVWLAKAYGLFEAEGLDVEVPYQDNGTDWPAAMVRSGQAQLCTTGMELAVIDQDNGGPLTAIASNINHLPLSLISRPEIRSLADLRGKTIGVSSLRNGTSAIITKLMARHGMKQPDDYKLFAMGPIETRWKMLQSGEIDAGLQGVPMDFIALDAGYNKLADGSDVFPEYQFSCYSVRRDWAASHRDIVVRFLRAILAATRLFYADKEKCRAVSMKEAHYSADYADRAWEAVTSGKNFPMDGDISDAGLAAVIAASAEIRGVPARAGMKPEDYVDRSYLFEARRTMKG